MTTSAIAILILVIAGIAVFLSRDSLGGRPVPAALQPGQPLPKFSLTDEDGNEVSSEQLLGTPAVIIFVRGSWCPFCSKQVRNLTSHYKAIADSGAKLILITPKPLETTRRVADFFEVDFEFWLDDSLRVSRELGLLVEGGVPKNAGEEYGDDTLWPTSLVIDAEGVIRLTLLSRFIADRPNPERLLQTLRSIA